LNIKRYIEKRDDSTDLILEEIIPGSATQNVADYEFEEIKRDVEDNAVKPDNNCPSPSNAMDSRKSPVAIHSDECCNLNGKPETYITGLFFHDMQRKKTRNEKF
jgi:hypothetical protein